MRQLAFLDMLTEAPFPSDDHLVFPPLRQAGFEVTWIPWQREGVNWRQFEMVVIRATYDYFTQPQTFLERLEEIEANGVKLANPFRVVRWNVEKTYLLAMAKAGIPVVPTRSLACLEPSALQEIRAQFNRETLVFKPSIGASSDGILVLESDAEKRVLSDLARRMEARSYLVQPFLDAICDRGEYSLFYFGGTFSHAVIKRPQAGDFRVQGEFGGTTRAVEPPSEAIALADQSLAWVGDPVLYARVDIVPTERGCLLMELELVEPQLFLANHPQAPARFAKAIQAYLEAEAFNGG